MMIDAEERKFILQKGAADQMDGDPYSNWNNPTAVCSDRTHG